MGFIEVVLGNQLVVFAGFNRIKEVVSAFFSLSETTHGSSATAALRAKSRTLKTEELKTANSLNCCFESKLQVPKNIELCQNNSSISRYGLKYFENRYF